MSGYVLLDGAGDFLSTPHHADFNVGVLDVIACVAMDDFTPSGHQTVLSKWGSSSGYYCRISNYPAITVAWQDPYAELSGGATNGTDGEPMWIRWRRFSDGGNVRVTGYRSFDPVDTDPTAVTWTQAGSELGGAIPAITTNTSALTIGVRQSGEYLAGKVYGVWFYSGTHDSGGTLLADPDFRTAAQGWDSPPGTDDQGRVWSFNGDAAWVPPEEGVFVFFDITDLPADFGNAETAEIVVRTRGVDIGATPLKLFAQIFQSDETTTLSDEVEVASHASDSSFANSSPITFTGLNTSADKAVWDAARIRFRWGT